MRNRCHKHCGDGQEDEEEIRPAVYLANEMIARGLQRIVNLGSYPLVPARLLGRIFRSVQQGLSIEHAHDLEKLDVIVVKLCRHVWVRVQLAIQIKIEDALESVTMRVKEVLVIPRIPIVLNLGRPQQCGWILHQVATIYDKGSSRYIDSHQVVLDGAFRAGLVELFRE